MKAKINTFFPQKPRDVLSWLREQPVTPGEWLALVKRQARELSYREAAIELGLTVNRIMQLSNPKTGILKRTRRGFVSTKSVNEFLNHLENRL